MLSRGRLYSLAAARFAVLRFADDFFAAEPLRFMPAILLPVLRFAAPDFAVERLVVLLFLALERFMPDFAVLRLVDFFAAERDAVLRAPPERLALERVLELFVDEAFRAPLRPLVDFAVEAFFVAAIGTPPELEWECAGAPRWARRGAPAWRARECGGGTAATRPPRGS